MFATCVGRTINSYHKLFATGKPIKNKNVLYYFPSKYGCTFSIDTESRFILLTIIIDYLIVSFGLD